MVLPDELRQLFRELEAVTVLNEEAVAQALFRFHDDHPSLPESIQSAWEAERFAFTLYADDTGERSCWGTFFRPAFITYERGVVRSSHAREAITADTINYWSQRAMESHHSVLRARYADVAWELAPLVDGATRRIGDATTATDSYVDRVRRSTEIYPDVQWLRRALNLSLAIHDESHVDQVVQALFDLHDRASDPAKVGTSIALFDTLFPIRRKLRLTQDRLDRIVTSLEHSLRVTAGVENEQTTNHHAAQSYGERLIKYYRSTGSQPDVERVTGIFAAAIERMADKAIAILAAAWLSDAYLAYQHAGMKAEADRLLVKLKEKGRQSRGQMVSHVTSHTFTGEEVEAYLNEVTSGGLEACFQRIVTLFLPKSADLRNRLATYRQKYPLVSMFPIALVDDDQVIAHIGSAENDEEGRLVHEIAQDMQFWSLFLMHSLERMFQGYELTPEGFVDLLYRSPLFGVERYQLLKNGIRHYCEDDHIAAIHVLIPQVEHALRVLLEGLQRPTNLHNPKLGAYQEKDLGAILADEAITKLFGEDPTRYLRALLTDQCGWNLRNRLSHGLYASHFFVRQIADRVVHAMMVISMIRLNRENEAEGQ
ncbi:MAG TPA: DUF4209 domain-containing protein [Tepidisphaeraceae bacterium]|nr:DUF4209 domain-containing protein [Tepidisphaeraceae bacterium]